MRPGGRSIPAGAPALLAGLAIAASAPAQAGDNDPVAPFKIADSLYYVGASDIASYLISTDDGLILIDGGYETTAPQILANLKTLGFEPRQVKILLNTHGHFDHAAGLATLKAATGATFYASAQDGALIARGGKGDFFLGDRYPYTPVKPDKTVADGEGVTLGGLTLTAHLTPGHTRGCTTWTFPVKVDGATRQALILCSLTVLPGYRLAKNPSYPGIAADYERSYATWTTLPCDVFLGSHGQFFRMAEKRAAMKPGAPNPFVDPEGCKTYFAAAKARFDAELKKQQAEP